MKYENFNETTLLALLVMMTFWEVEGCSTFLNCLTEKKFYIYLLPLLIFCTGSSWVIRTYIWTYLYLKKTFQIINFFLVVKHLGKNKVKTDNFYAFQRFDFSSQKCRKLQLQIQIEKQIYLNNLA